MTARAWLLAVIVALAARPLAAYPNRVSCSRSITGGTIMGQAINTNGDPAQIQLRNNFARGGNVIPCGGDLIAGDTGLTLVKGSTVNPVEWGEMFGAGSQYLIEAEMSIGTGPWNAWGIISGAQDAEGVQDCTSTSYLWGCGSCNNTRVVNRHLPDAVSSVSGSLIMNTFTVPPSGTVTMRIAHANSYGRLRIVCVNVRVFFLRVRVAELRAWMRNVCVCVCVCVMCVACVHVCARAYPAPPPRNLRPPLR